MLGSGFSHPEVAIALGALGPESLATLTVLAVSRSVMRRADLVVALGEEMRERCIGAGSVPERTIVVPNWSDADSVHPVPRERNPLRVELAGGAEVVVMYSGNIGRGHDVETLLAAARRLRDHSDIVFVFVGDGAKRADVDAARRELRNVRVAEYQPRERLSQSLSAGDIHLIALAPEMEGLIEPSKLYGIMAAGRPAVFGPARSEVARTIRRENCGRVVPNGDVDALTATLLELAEDAALRGAVGWGLPRGKRCSHVTRAASPRAGFVKRSKVCMRCRQMFSSPGHEPGIVDTAQR